MLLLSGDSSFLLFCLQQRIGFHTIVISYRAVEKIVVPESWGNGGGKEKKKPGEGGNEEGRRKEGRKEFSSFLLSFFPSFYRSSTPSSIHSSCPSCGSRKGEDLFWLDCLDQWPDRHTDEQDNLCCKSQSSTPWNARYHMYGILVEREQDYHCFSLPPSTYVDF